MSNPLAQSAFRISITLAAVGLGSAFLAAVVGLVLLVAVPSGSIGSLRLCARSDVMEYDQPVLTPGRCTARLAVEEAWSGGFAVTVVVTNSGERSVRGWAVDLTFPGDQRVLNSWGARVAQSGQAVHVVNADHNGVLDAAGSTSFGLVGSGAPPDGADLICVPR
jgi:cellulase/cellobiase CelA1